MPLESASEEETAGCDPHAACESEPGRDDCHSQATARNCDALPSVLRVEPWSPPGLATGRSTFPPSHRYIEILWTPVLGPSQVILLRRLAEVALPAAEGQVDVAELAVAIGSQPAADGTVGSRSALGRGIARLERFRLVAWRKRCTLAVATRVPPLSDRDLDRLPGSFRELHQRFVKEPTPPSS